MEKTKIYGYMKWEEFCYKFGTQEKIKELNSVFKYTNAPSWTFYRVEMDENSSPIFVKYVGFEEEEWTQEQESYAEVHGITKIGNANIFEAWLYFNETE